jgi:hypothetical protein
MPADPPHPSPGPPSNPKLIPLYEAAKRQAVARRRKDEADRLAAALRLICDAYRAEMEKRAAGGGAEPKPAAEL